MTKKSITVEVTRVIDNNLAIKKLLCEGLINNLALARKIKKDYNLRCSLSAVLSSVRRYNDKLVYNDYLKDVYKLLENSDMVTKTNLFSALIKKNPESRKGLASIYSELEPEDTFIVFETSRYIKIISGRENVAKIEKFFNKCDLFDREENIGLIKIIYGADITKTPGVFALLANELGANDISIVDSAICHSEHIIVVRVDDIQKAFDVIFNISHKKAVTNTRPKR